MTNLPTHKGPPNLHNDYMATALSLASRGLGNTWPNPAVGCVLVNEGRVVGRGWTQPGGRPHAEAVALERAGAAAKGATAYVTLEPCNHQGVSPPCTEALIKAGIHQVYSSVADPDERVAGTGLARLQEAGILVEQGLLAEKATVLNAGFFQRITLHRPLVTLKTATTLDGKIATRGGESQWITGEEARINGHYLRAQNDGIMIGSGTALADDPTLTCRLPGIANDRRPRIVLDSRLRLPLDSKLVKSAAAAPLWLVTSNDKSAAAHKKYEDHSVTVLHAAQNSGGGLDLGAVLAELANQGLTRLLVEGGGKLTASLIAADLVDRIAWFRSPSLMGNDGRAAVEDLNMSQLLDMPRFERTEKRSVGSDSLEFLARKR